MSSSFFEKLTGANFSDENNSEKTKTKNLQLKQKYLQGLLKPKKILQ